MRQVEVDDHIAPDVRILGLRHNDTCADLVNLVGVNVYFAEQRGNRATEQLKTVDAIIGPERLDKRGTHPVDKYRSVSPVRTFAGFHTFLTSILAVSVCKDSLGCNAFVGSDRKSLSPPLSDAVPPLITLVRGRLPPEGPPPRGWIERLGLDKPPHIAAVNCPAEQTHLLLVTEHDIAPDDTE